MAPPNDDTFDSDIEENFEVIDTDVLKNEEMLLHQGHGMYIGDRIKLSPREMTQLKSIVDEAINPTKSAGNAQPFDVNPSVEGLKIPPTHEKLQQIAVDIEKIDGRILVKVGACDLSGVGGHGVRERIIKDLVNQALQKAGIDATYETVNVSACIGVRGRLQRFVGLFVDNRQEDGTHMNAYIKTDKEPTLTHWEPRKGPQSFFNDTICAMVSSVCTSLFEKGIREDTIHSSAEATKNILQSPLLKSAFDHVLSIAKDRIVHLVDSVKQMIGAEHQQHLKDSLSAMKSDHNSIVLSPTSDEEAPHP